jgi:hypothetical protein
MPAADPTLRYLALHLPKQGHSEEEYEDALAANPSRGRFAVADGASESAFARLWAQLLTDHFLAARRSRRLSEWVEDARRHWSAQVMGLDLPWYAEMKREEGAFATLLGVSFHRPTAGRPWRFRAVAVGDSCLLQVRGDRRVRAFPVQRSSDFGNQPRLISSREAAIPASLSCSGSIRPGDRFFLMTDALAEWFLSCFEKDGRPWEAIASLSSSDGPGPEAAFAAWVEQLRAQDNLRNDDVTLLIIEPGSRAEGGTP